MDNVRRAENGRAYMGGWGWWWPGMVSKRRNSQEESQKMSGELGNEHPRQKEQ